MHIATWYYSTMVHDGDLSEKLSMKNNMKITLLIVGVIVLAALVLLLVCSRGKREQVVVEPVISDDIDTRTPLFAFADTMEEAEKIAELYDIEFIGFSDGVATYHTDKNLSEIVEKSNEDNNPKLYLNYKRNMHITETNVQ